MSKSSCWNVFIEEVTGEERGCVGGTDRLERGRGRLRMTGSSWMAVGPGAAVGLSACPVATAHPQAQSCGCSGSLFGVQGWHRPCTWRCYGPVEIPAGLVPQLSLPLPSCSMFLLCFPLMSQTDCQGERWDGGGWVGEWGCAHFPKIGDGIFLSGFSCSSCCGITDPVGLDTFWKRNAANLSGFSLVVEKEKRKATAIALPPSLFIH